MAIVAGAAIAGVVAGVSAGVVATSVVTGVIIGAVQFGVTIVTSLLGRRRPDAASTPDDFASPVTVISPISPVKVVYGESVVSGTLVYSNTSGDDNKYLHLVLVLAGHEVESVADIYIDDIPRWDDSIKYLVSTHIHKGSKYQLADPELVSVFPQWSADHRLQGNAYIHVKIEQDYKTWRGIPNVKAVVRGRKVVNQNQPNYTKVNNLVCAGSTSLVFESPQVVGTFFYNNKIEVVLTNISTFGGGSRLYIFGDVAKPENGSLYYDFLSSQLVYLSKRGQTYSLGVELPLDIAYINLSLNATDKSIILGVNDKSQHYSAEVREVSSSIVDIVNSGVNYSIEKYRITAGVDTFVYVDLLDHNATISGGVIDSGGTAGEITLTGNITTAYVETDDTERWYRCWSKNPAANIQDYMTDTRYGLGVPWEQIDVAGFALAWQICKQQVPNNFNPCPRPLYTLDGSVDTSKTLGDNISNMITSCGGVITWSDGKYNLTVAAPVSPVKTITSSDIVDIVDFQIAKDKSQIFNTVKAIYLSKDRLWQSAETPLYKDDQAIDDDNGEILAELNLPYTDNVHSAQRLSQIFLNMSRLEGTLSILTKWNHTELRSMDVVVVNNPESGINNEEFRIADWRHVPATLDSPGGIELQMFQYSPNAYSFEETEQEITILPEIEIPDLTLPPPQNFAARSDRTTYSVDLGAQVVLTWSAVLSSLCTGYTIRATIEYGSTYEIELGGKNTVNTTDSRPSDGDTVVYSIRSKGTGGLVSEWVTITHIVSVGNSIPQTPTDYRVLNTVEYEEFIGG